MLGPSNVSLPGRTQPSFPLSSGPAGGGAVPGSEPSRDLGRAGTLAEPGAAPPVPPPAARRRCSRRGTRGAAAVFPGGRGREARGRGRSAERGAPRPGTMAPSGKVSVGGPGVPPAPGTHMHTSLH